MANRFGELGGKELRNQALLQFVSSTYGTTMGASMFEDLRWLNDPQAPVSVPSQGSLSMRPAPGPLGLPSGLAGPSGPGGPGSVDHSPTSSALPPRWPHRTRQPGMCGAPTASRSSWAATFGRWPLALGHWTCPALWWTADGL